MRHEAQALSNVRGPTLDREQRLLHVEVLHSALHLPDVADVNRDPRHFLAGVVVQVTRDPRPLRLLRVNEPAGQVADSLVRTTCSATRRRRA